MNATKVKVLQRWSVLDTREDPQAEVYELALVEDEHGARSLCRKIHAPEKRAHFVPITKPDTNENMDVFVQNHITFLEDRYCFVLELKGVAR